MISRSRWRTCCSVVLFAGSVAMRAGAQEQTGSAAAEVLFDEGRRLMESGDLAGACEKFLASNKSDPAPGTLLNLGDCYEKAGRTASAWTAFRDASAMAARAGDEKRQRIADERAGTLAPKLSRLTVKAPSDRPSGFAIERDGSALPTDLWEVPSPVDPGAHEIRASAPGRRPWTTRVEIGAPPTQQTVQIPNLAVDPSAVRATQQTPPEHGSMQRSTTGNVQRGVGLGVGALGLVGMGIGTYFAVRAANTWDDATAICPNETRCTGDGVALGNDAGTFADLSTGLFIAGGALAAGGVVLWLTAPSDGVPPARASVGVGPGGARVELSGAF